MYVRKLKATLLSSTSLVTYRHGKLFCYVHEYFRLFRIIDIFKSEQFSGLISGFTYICDWVD
jgi:hypothetical protein